MDFDDDDEMLMQELNEAEVADIIIKFTGTANHVGSDINYMHVHCTHICTCMYALLFTSQ